MRPVMSLTKLLNAVILRDRRCDEGSSVAPDFDRAHGRLDD